MHKGTCLCRGVQYTVTGDPLTVAVCHCPDCAAYTGSMFGTNAWYTRENLQITAGENLLKTFRNMGRMTPNNTVDRQFCTVCGSNLFGTVTRPDPLVFVAVGTLIGDLGPEFTPQKEFFCQFRVKWLHPVEGASSDASDVPFALTKLSWRDEDVRDPQSDLTAS
ncbi:Mss4-like protein [Mycena vulgaris]|nr:Mss4-like protein [Mycena vulgaris]